MQLSETNMKNRSKDEISQQIILIITNYKDGQLKGLAIDGNQDETS